MVCNLTNPFGFASGIHDVLWCFIKAYSTQRRLVLLTSHWHYAPDGWETLFQPLSENCQDNFLHQEEISPWPGENSKELFVTILRNHFKWVKTYELTRLLFILSNN